MAKPDPQTAKKEEKRRPRNWVITIFFATNGISASISLVSDLVMGKSSMIEAFLILLMIVFIGIIFDIVGMAVATADEKPFHAMAARKVSGAKECIMLLRNAERVSSTTPRLDARWPPVFATEETMKSRISDASWVRWTSVSFARSACPRIEDNNFMVLTTYHFFFF